MHEQRLIRLIGFVREPSLAWFCAPIIPSFRGIVNDVDDSGGRPRTEESTDSSHDAQNMETFTNCSSRARDVNDVDDPGGRPRTGDSTDTACRTESSKPPQLRALCGEHFGGGPCLGRERQVVALGWT